MTGDDDKPRHDWGVSLVPAKPKAMWDRQDYECVEDHLIFMDWLESGPPGRRKHPSELGVDYTFTVANRWAERALAYDMSGSNATGGEYVAGGFEHLSRLFYREAAKLMQLSELRGDPVVDAKTLVAIGNVFLSASYLEAQKKLQAAQAEAAASGKEVDLKALSAEARKALLGDFKALKAAGVIKDE